MTRQGDRGAPHTFWCDAGYRPSRLGGESRLALGPGALYRRRHADVAASVLVLVIILGVELGAVAAAAVLVLLIGGLVFWRVESLQRRPADEELASKPFWKL